MIRSCKRRNNSSSASPSPTGTCAGSTASLFLEKFSLIRVWTFPVPMRREFGCKLLTPSLDRTPNIAEEGRILENSLLISLFGAETGSQLTASSARQSGLFGPCPVCRHAPDRLVSGAVLGRTAFAMSCSMARSSTPSEKPQIVIESWRRHYNTIRPHASLDYKPPAPEVFVPAFAACPAALRHPAPPAKLAQRPTLN